MSKRLKIHPLIKSTSAYVIASAIGQGMSFLAVIVFTRIMPKNDYGNYSTYYAYVAILTVLIGSNLYYALNNAYIDIKEDIISFRKTVLLLSTIIAVIITFVIWLIGKTLWRKFDTFSILMAAVHAFAFFVISYRIYSANMANEYKCKCILLILPNAAQFCFALILIVLLPFMAYKARVLGSAIGVACVAVVVYVEMLTSKGAMFHKDYWKYALSIAVPSVPMSISYMLMQHCDKVMITHYCGADETAVYAAIYYLGYVIIAINQAIAPVRQAWIYRKLDAGDTKEAVVLQKWYLILFALIITGMMMFGEIAVMIITPESYWNFAYIVPFILSASLLMVYGFYVEIVLFYKRNASLSLIVLIAALINIGLNSFCISKFGAVSACYTTVFAYALMIVLTAMIADKDAKQIYSGLYFVFFSVWIAIMSVIYFFVTEKTVIRYGIYTIALIVIGLYSMSRKTEWQCFLREQGK